MSQETDTNMVCIDPETTRMTQGFEWIIDNQKGQMIAWHPVTNHTIEASDRKVMMAGISEHDRQMRAVMSREIVEFIQEMDQQGISKEKQVEKRNALLGTPRIQMRVKAYEELPQEAFRRYCQRLGTDEVTVLNEIADFQDCLNERKAV